MVYGTILDLDSLFDYQQPQDILTINYNGVMTSSFFVEGLYSNRNFTFQNYGARSTDLIAGTLMRDLSHGNARYNAPTFCGVCDPETRDNTDWYIKATYFLSTEKLGSHNIVLGFDDFAGTLKSNNYQSGSNYRLWGTGAIWQDASGNYLGDIYPVIGPNSFVYYTPIDTLSKGSRPADPVGLRQRHVAPERPALVQPRREVGQERREGQPGRRDGGRQRLEPPPRGRVGRHGERQGEGRRELRQLRRRHPGDHRRTALRTPASLPPSTGTTTPRMRPRSTAF